MKKIFYILAMLVALAAIAAMPPVDIKGVNKSVSKSGFINLCRLRNGTRGYVQGIIYETDPEHKRTTIIYPKTGCKAMVIGKDFPQDIQRGIQFRALVQQGYLRLPDYIKFQDNVGTVEPYREVYYYLRTRKDFNIENETAHILMRFEDDMPKQIVTSDLKNVRKMKTKYIHKLYIDSNNVIREVKPIKKRKQR